MNKYDIFVDSWIYSGLPDSKQIVAASATYTEELVTHLCNYMSNPTFIRLNSNDPVLLGMCSFCVDVTDSQWCCYYLLVGAFAVPLMDKGAGLYQIKAVDA